jgi:hypothetical protein
MTERDLVILLVILAFSCVSLPGCDQEASNWSRTSSQDTVEVYESYLKDYQEGPHAPTARVNLREARWREICKADSASVYLKFLDEDFDSKHAGEAIEKLRAKSPPSASEQQALDAATKVNMRFAFEKVLNSYPRSVVAYEARRRMARFGILTAADEVLIPVSELRAKYGWDGRTNLWKWGEGTAAIEMPNGSVGFLADQTEDPAFGLPMEFGMSGTVSGSFCLGNLQLSGACLFPEDGIRLKTKASLTYPLPAGAEPQPTGR